MMKDHGQGETERHEKKKNNHDYGIWSLNFHIVTKNEELYKLCYF